MISTLQPFRNQRHAPLAGNFGFTNGHGEVSEACAERVLLPRLREADADTVVLADGFSCRTQIHELDSGGRDGVHLAELLAAAQEPPAAAGPAEHGRRPEDRMAARPHSSSALARYAALAGAAAVAAGIGAGLVGAGRRLARSRT